MASNFKAAFSEGRFRMCHQFTRAALRGRVPALGDKLDISPRLPGHVRAAYTDIGMMLTLYAINIRLPMLCGMCST